MSCDRYKRVVNKGVRYRRGTEVMEILMVYRSSEKTPYLLIYRRFACDPEG